MSISRRDFLGTAALGAVAAPLVSATGMPMRLLGSTGAHVSLLAFGGGSRFVGYGEGPGLAALNHALDLGITYIDTCDSYGANGESQLWIGKVLKQRGRQGLWLASKVGPRKYDDFMRMLDVSLKRLQVDHVDLLHIHALMGPDDLAAVSAKGGAYEAAMKAKEQKMARFIGITCHAFPDVLKTALERHDFDCTQMALNAAMRSQVKDAQPSFETVALPVALRKKMGVTAMKIFAQDALVGQASAGEADSLFDVAAGGRDRHRHAQGGAHRAECGGGKSLQAATRTGDEEDVRRALGKEQNRPGSLLPRPPGRVISAPPQSKQLIRPIQIWMGSDRLPVPLTL